MLAGTYRPWALAAAAATALFGFGCANGGNGETGDSGSSGDTGMLPGIDASDGGSSGSGDTGSDAPQNDSTTHDGSSGDSGGKDATMKDTGPADMGPPDMGTDTGSCVTVTGGGDAGTATSCPAPVSGSCGMGSLSAFSPTWVPPSGSHQNLCTTKQISTIWTDCLSSTATASTCMTAQTKDATCFNCIFTMDTASSYGPLIETSNGLLEINIGGCIDLLEPCNQTCAAALLGDFQCEQAACATNCPVTTSASLTAYETCTTTADGCDPNGCHSYLDQSQCAAQLTGPTHPASVCVPGSASTFKSLYDSFAPLFCGP